MTALRKILAAALDVVQALAGLAILVSFHDHRPLDDMLDALATPHRRPPVIDQEGNPQ